MTEVNRIRLLVAATVSDTLDSYFCVREDSRGKFLVYAFKEGTPPHNRKIVEGSPCEHDTIYRGLFATAEAKWRLIEALPPSHVTIELDMLVKIMNKANMFVPCKEK